MLPSMTYAGIRYTSRMDRKSRHLIQHLEQCQRIYEEMEREGTALWNGSIENLDRTGATPFDSRHNRGIIGDVDDCSAE